MKVELILCTTEICDNLIYDNIMIYIQLLTLFL